MRAYEVDKDGRAVVYVTVPHSRDALEHQGSYRFVPRHTIYGEAAAAPFALDASDDDDDQSAGGGARRSSGAQGGKRTSP